MIKLQDFAAQLGVTDRQVQRLLRKYENEFEGLIERRGNNGTWLSDEACDLLRGKTRQQPVTIYDGRADELKKENDELKDELIFAYKRIDTLRDMCQDALKDASEQKLLAAKAADEANRADREAAARADAEERARSEAARAAELEARIAALEGENEAAKRENEALRSRSLWQRIWNK